MASSQFSVVRENDKNQVPFWVENKTFKKVNQNKSKNSFVLLDGPPYANGPAHMGHALNKLLKDLFLKTRWYLGNSVEYQPGWDCHGLPLELAVEKTRGRLEPNELRFHCKELALKSMDSQKKSFQSLGVLSDWENPYLTLSENAKQGSWATLKTLFEKNLLEYKQYPVHYCPVCASSLAEAELESKKLPKDSLYFKMKLDGSLNKNTYALVWTTTPWTLPMNQALAVGNSLSYDLWENDVEQCWVESKCNDNVLSWLKDGSFKKVSTVLGKNFPALKAWHPLLNKTVPVCNVDWVEEGCTGFVHMAFAHGPEDFQEGVKRGFLPETFLDKTGRFLFESDHVLFELNGQKQSTAGLWVVEKLKELKTLVNHTSDSVEQSVCWRHKCGVYYQATWQVFLKLNDPSCNLKQQVKDLLLTSSVSKKEALMNMMESRPNWCLSRQRYWGTPLNLLVDDKQNLSPFSSFYLELLSQGKVEEAQLFLSKHPNLKVLTDVLDVWFDSGNVANLRVFNGSLTPTVDLVVEGKDQYRGWFQSLLWLTVAVHKQLPFKEVLSHGFVLDQFRQKLSKSQGNGGVVDEFVNKYGLDVLRLWVATQSLESDPVLSETKLKESQKLYQRMRLTLRFLSSYLKDYDYLNHASQWQKAQDSLDSDLSKYVLKELSDLKNRCEHFFKNWELKKALDDLYGFLDKTLSSVYLDAVKYSLYLNAPKSSRRLHVQASLWELFQGCLDLVQVFCPEVSEMFYQELTQGHQGSVFERPSWVLKQNSKMYLDWNSLFKLKRQLNEEVEKRVQSKEVKEKLQMKVELSTSNNKEVLEKAMLEEFFQVSKVTWVQSSDDHLNSLEFHGGVKCPRCRFYKEAFEMMSWKDEKLCLTCVEQEKNFNTES